MEDSEGISGDSPMESFNNALSMSNLPGTSYCSEPTRRPLLAPDADDYENIEMSTLQASQQNQYRDQQQNQRPSSNDHSIHWVYILIYMVLSLICLFCSIIDLLQRTHNFSAVPNYWNIILDMFIAANSLSMFCIVFEFSKRNSDFPNRPLIPSLICAVLNMLSAIFFFYIQSEMIVLAVLISTSLLLLQLFLGYACGTD